MERLELLKEPFKTAFLAGSSIDYKTNPNSKIGDHGYVEKYGYTAEMHSDCSYSAPGLHGFSLSSYGNWGTVHTSDLDDEGKEIFFNMIEENIIKPWRIRAYVKGDWFDYEDGKGWQTYDKESGWISCSSPYKKMNDMDDIKFVQNKLCMAFSLPKSFLNFETEKPRVTVEENKKVDELENVEVEEVKVGDTVRVYDKGFLSFITGKVTKIVKVYEPENFNPVAVVIIKYQVENAVNCLMEEERALTNKILDNYVVFNMYTKKEINSFTLKN